MLVLSIGNKEAARDKPPNGGCALHRMTKTINPINVYAVHITSDVFTHIVANNARKPIPYDILSHVIVC